MLNLPKSEPDGSRNSRRQGLGLCKIVQELNKVLEVETLTADTFLSPSMSTAAQGLGIKVTCSVPFSKQTGSGGESLFKSTCRYVWWAGAGRNWLCHIETSRLAQIIPKNKIRCIWDGRGVGSNDPNTSANKYVGSGRHSLPIQSVLLFPNDLQKIQEVLMKTMQTRNCKFCS